MSRFTCEPVLLDITGVPPCHCDDLLDGLFKAMAEDPEGDAARSIWTPHEEPLLRDHVEELTRRMSTVLQRVQDALSRLMFGQAVGELGKALAWQRWTPEEMAAARSLIVGKPASTYTLDDWLLVVDYLLQLYLPDGVVNDLAEYAVVRAGIMGKIAAAKPAPPPPDILEAWRTLTPTYFAQVPPRMLTVTEQAILSTAKVRAAISISHVTDEARTRMKRLVVEHVQASLLGQKEGTDAILKTRLFDEFGALNRDFRRIAVTEAGNAMCEGIVAATPHGQRLKRKEAYRGACKWCKSINDKVFTVVAPPATEAEAARLGATSIWLGKSNMGRSASPRKREGGVLVDRAPGEQWWVAAGLQHPHCRGTWVPVVDAGPAVDPAFAASLDDMIARHRAKFGPPPRT